jgi:hypothetical protein
MYFVQGMDNEIICCECKPFHSISAKKKKSDLSDAVMPATASVIFRNRDPDGTVTHSLSSGITLIRSDK